MKFITGQVTTWLLLDVFEVNKVLREWGGTFWFNYGLIMRLFLLPNNGIIILC